MMSFTSEPFEILTIQLPIVAARPVSLIAAPMTITPMVRITVLDENWPNATENLHTPKITISAQPRMAVVAIGSLSQTNRTMQKAKMINEMTSIPMSVFLSFTLPAVWLVFSPLLADRLLDYLIVAQTSLAALI